MLLLIQAIAADPKSTISGYLIGGSAWFSIPFCLATTWGLEGAAVESSPNWPTYPNRMTAEQVAQGTTLPWAALTVLGKPGAAAIMVMLSMVSVLSPEHA